MIEKTHAKRGFYPASYLVMTVTSLLLVGSVTGLMAITIDYWLNGTSGILNDIFLLYWVAAMIVLLPIHLFAYWQVRRTDKTQVTVFSLRFANGLLGAYLFVTVGSFISLSTWLVALWLNVWLGTGDVDKHLGAASLSLFGGIVILAYLTQHFMRVRDDQSRPKYYMLTTACFSIAILLLSLFYPAMAYRDVARDTVKENDLAQINQEIGDYVDTHNNLPTQLTALSDLSEDTQQRFGDYEYTPRGGTELGVFGYTLCTTFAKSQDKGRDIGFGFWSHGAGKQCFVRTTISFEKLNQQLVQDAKNATNGIAKLQAGIQSFLLGAKHAVDQEITGVETFASGQVKGLEKNLEGLEGGTTELQQEMQRLEGNLNGLEGNTGDLAQDFVALQKFLHDLGCIFGGCKAS